ncbi:tetratricopeptide repeat protein [Desulfosarcina variabilis str. Montpellier]|uniref:tetratricopeptide repeat protein n=1 Tax=Desulfosarcina variabilis TaxID=2300 RepID=UPI003AFAB30F
MRTGFILNPIFGRWSVWLRLTGVLILVMLAWMPAAAAKSADGPAFSRAEQRVVHAAQQAMAAKRYAEAQRDLSAYIKKQGGKVHYRVEFSLGNAWMLDGKPEQALPHYQAAAAQHTSDAALWQNLGKACFDLGRFGEAADSLAKAHRLTTPPSKTLAYQAAVAYIQAKHPEKARPLLEQIMDRTDDDPDPAWLEALLKVYLDLGQKERALDLARSLVQGKGQDPRLWQVLAHLYMQAKLYDQAAAAMQVRASLTRPTREEIILLGDLYRMAGVPLKAARQYEKLLAENVRPKDVAKVASAYLAARRVDAAIDVLERGVDRHPTFRLWWLLAGAYYEREDFEKALTAFEQCNRCNPKNARAFLMKGYCALQLDQLETAETAFTEAARFPCQNKEAQQRLKELRQYRMSISMRDDML